ncbi:ankyrin-3 [Bombina bombina]|uniref:ankyrin-3 n=1 Tax=Bombina bombina TaxID=8345 RepID=UPI00235AFC33|nr:ankyrin-3 [Bombina bombina]
MLQIDQYGNTTLHYAARTNNMARVVELLSDEYSVISRNGSGLTPLHFAAFGGNVGILRLLLSHAPHAINLQSIKGSSLLHEAVLGANTNAVKFLINNRANPNLQDQEGNTPLHIAVLKIPTHVAVQICQALLDGGAATNLQNEIGENFFFAAMRRVAKGGSRSSDLLMSLAMLHGGNLLHRNADGLTILDVLRREGAPLKVIRDIQKKTQEQQKLFLDQTSYNIYQPPPPTQIPGPSGRWQRRKGKLFVCGQTGAGKTTFTQTLSKTGLLPWLQYLCTEPNPPESTKGVSLCHSEYEAGSVVIWDFAGQMEYYFTHALLLATRGENVVYCLVFSLEGVESDHRGAQNRIYEQVMKGTRSHLYRHKPVIGFIGAQGGAGMC